MKLLFKALFLIAALSLLVVTGMSNKQNVSFNLERVLPKPLNLPAAMMYFAFFAIGLITGALLFAGGGRGGGSSKGEK